MSASVVVAPVSLKGLSSASSRASPSPRSASLLTPIGTSAPSPRSDVVSFWLRNRLLSSDRVERHFAFLIAMLVSAALLFVVMKREGSPLLWGSPICSLWASALVAVTLGGVWAEQNERWAVMELCRLAQFLLTMLSVLIYYDGSNVINRYRYASQGPAMLWDTTLLKMDEILWGWLWPRGQMALWLDTQPTFGVTTFIGRCYAELFQILYVSYYFWGNAIGVILAIKYFYFSVWRKAKNTRKRSQWRNIQMFVSAWVGAFVLNHLINLCFPAVSPRIFLKDAYQNELKGLWVLASMRNAITNAAANTFSAFPSGHCGLSILAVLLAFRINLSRWYTLAVGVSTVLIVLATQVLRYHYFVDFLFSTSIVLFGAYLGGFHDAKLYEQCLQQNGLEDTDEEGKFISADGRPVYEALPLADMSSNSSQQNGSALSASAADGATGRDEELGQGDHHTDDEHHDNHSSSTENGAEGRTAIAAAVFGMSRALSSQKLKNDDAV